MPQTPEIFLDAKGIFKSFRRDGQEIPILNGIDLALPCGTVTVIRGRSGTGKSTLLSLLAGLDRPTSGSINLNGNFLERLDNESLALLRKQTLGFVFQSFNLLPSWTARENVEAVLMHSGLPPERRREKVVALMTKLDLSERLEHLPHQLSVGQQQRVAVARTLVNEPQLILADEPTGDVDSETAAEMLNLLIGSVREKGATLLVATHGSFPLKLADRLYSLENGKLVENPS
ncbi:MAG: ABC transporter ATP-binding protein [Candidatus Ozemobacteraceae bacterium]